MIIRSMQDIVEYAKAINTKTLVVACAGDKEVLEAVETARKNNIVNAILVGDEFKIKSYLSGMGYDVNNYEIINETDKAKACEISVQLVSKNDNYFLMKGFVDTSIILKAALNKEWGLRTKNRISHVSVFEVPTHDKLIFMTDGAMNISPNLDDKRQIIENSIKIAHATGIKKPNVGIIAAVEKINPKMQATLDAEQLVKMNKEGIIDDCIVGGPFAIDNAINVEAAKHKGLKDPIAGNVDILVMNAIEAGNVFYKTMMFLANAKSASVIAGASKPIVLTSRADTPVAKFYSIALAALVANL